LSEKVAKLRELAELEEKYAVGYDDDVAGLGNVAIAGLMAGVALDSRKHAALFRAIAVILEGPLGITDVEYDRLEASLKKHVEVEAGMLEDARALLEGVEDDRARRLLEEIVADEVRHHAFLSGLLEAVLARDMIFEQDVWDMIWRDVPTHGAPRDPYAPGV
jgi:hypothetical protein